MGINLYVVSEQQLDSREWPPNSCQEEIGENSTNVKVGTNPSRHHLDRFRSLENGERTSTKSCGLLEEETVWLQCDVYDTGIGIPGMILASVLAMKRQLCIANAIFVDSLILMLEFFFKMPCPNDVYFPQSDKALPTLFKKYMQVSADHARKYGGTGLGLAICKQLVICISFPFHFSRFGSYITLLFALFTYPTVFCDTEVWSG